MNMHAHYLGAQACWAVHQLTGHLATMDQIILQADPLAGSCNVP